LEEIDNNDRNKLIFEEDVIIIENDIEKDQSDLIEMEGINTLDAENKEYEDKISMSKDGLLNSLIGLMKSHDYSSQDIANDTIKLGNNYQSDLKSDDDMKAINMLVNDVKNITQKNSAFINDSSDINNTTNLRNNLNSNPFILTIENEDIKISKNKALSKNQKKPENKKISPGKYTGLDNKEKKRIIKINNTKKKFSNFEDEDSDW
jgi:hypothetical protein